MDEKKNARLQKELIEMVMRQTNLSYEESEEELKNNNNDYMKVIKKANGILEKKEEKITSINQSIYKELRGYLDKCSLDYMERKEIKEGKEEYMHNFKYFFLFLSTTRCRVSFSFVRDNLYGSFLGNYKYRLKG